MVLMLTPKALIASSAATRDNGMAIRLTRVARRLTRKAKTMSTTSSAPSRSAASRLSMASPMKSAWRKTWVSMCMPSGSVAWMSASTSSMARVSVRVFAPGCFWMPITTAGWPFAAATPRLSAGPMRTSAMCLTSTGSAPRMATVRRTGSTSVPKATSSPPVAGSTAKLCGKPSMENQARRGLRRRPRSASATLTSSHRRPVSTMWNIPSPSSTQLPAVTRISAGVPAMGARTRMPGSSADPSPPRERR
jgi:hypothetical protein